jgi:hypothetical protein
VKHAKTKGPQMIAFLPVSKLVQFFFIFAGEKKGVSK